MVDVTRRSVLLGGGASLALAGFGGKATAETFSNPSYFGVELLKAAGKNLHGNRTADEVAADFNPNVYTPETIAAAFVAEWEEAGNSSAKQRIIDAFANNDRGPFDALFNGRRDQGLVATINDQLTRILPAAIRDIAQGNGTEGRSDYKQIADVGLQGALKILEHVKNTEPENFDAVKGQLEVLAPIMSDAWTQGVEQFRTSLGFTLATNAPTNGPGPIVPALR